MLTLADFILACVAKDEAVAIAFRDADGIWGPDTDNLDAAAIAGAFEGGPGSVSRVLAECEAKRQIMDAHTARTSYPIAAIHDDGSTSDIAEGSFEAIVRTRRGCSVCAPVYSLDPCLTLALLALPYADHPDYREEWRP